MIDRIVLNILMIAGLTLNFSGSASASVTIDDPLSRANSYLAQGQYFLAEQEANNALQNAVSKTQQSQAYGMKGNILLHLYRYGEAEESLLLAFDLAEDTQHKAGYANSLGVVYHELGDKNKSEQYFTAALALTGNDSILALQIKLNRLRAQPQHVELPLLNELLTQISTVDSPEERVRYYLNLASIAKSHSQQVEQTALEKAQADSARISNNSLRVEILDSLAELYETQGKDQRALELSEQASTLAGQRDVDDLLINIEWRKGKIYRLQERDQDALIAFGKAVDYINNIRRDIPITYESGKSSFIEKLGPIYLDYVRQLLKKSGGYQEGEAKQRLLQRARETIEQIKQTELEDYLGGRCMFEGVVRSELDSIDAQAAILYPIILPDRLELLVGTGKTVRQYTIHASQERIDIEAAAKDIAKSLRTPPSERTKNYRRSSEELYQWMIAPIEKDLKKESIKTLVIVPDGVLRLVPFAALSDGKQFLVEKYALSVSPGMSLLSSSKDAQKPRHYRMLSAGLKIPGPVVEKLLKQRIDAKFISQDPEGFDEEIKKAQKKLRLPQVETELKNINNIDALKNETLLNEQFTVANFNQQIEGKSYEIIHIASHGEFSSDANSSYLMAYDDTLELDNLKKLLKRDKDTQGGIQLLTFSACQTAEGDDRAPLGFTGAALKAEALSALGSLWPVSDKATAQLMTNFYQHLTQHRGKAESLRQAQLELLNDPDMQDPFYWAPFILVGSWL